MKFRNKKTGEVVDFSPCLINSALLSAQNRQRYYWCNWSVEQPQDQGIVLADILESGVVDRDKSHCLGANYFKGGNLKSYFEKNRRQLVFNSAAIVGRKINPKTGKREDYNHDLPTVQTLEVQNHGKARCLSTVSKDCLVSNLPPGRYQENLSYRKLTVVECCRLQGVPDNYFKVSSNTQAYKMLGNGWQCDTIEHIFNCLFDGA